MSENSVIQQGHTLVFRPDRSHEVRLSNNLIYSKDMSVILYVASGDATAELITRL